MLSMVNANRFISKGAIPLVLVAYAIFIWIDHAPMNRTVHHDLLRFQSGLANSSPDKRPGFDQRDCFGKAQFRNAHPAQAAT